MPEPTPDYLVISFGTTGDIYPFMRIASALQALGRNVTVITDTLHRGLVQGAGLPFVGLGTAQEHQRTLENPDLWDPRKGFSVLFANYSDLLRQMLDAIRSARTQGTQAAQVVIAHPLVVPGAVIARELGLVQRVVSAVLAPANLRTCHDPLHIGPLAVPPWVPMSWRRALWRYADKRFIDPIAVAQLDAVRNPLGLAKVQSFLTHMGEAPDLTVTLFPPWFAPAAPDWPRPLIEGDFPRFEAAPHDGFSQELSAFLAAGEKPVVFTPGTGHLHAAAFFACALSAVNRLGRRAVFLTRARAQVPQDLPESVLWQPYVPLSALLSHAAVLVHHGGIGTTAEALGAGIPQLIAPFAWDQFGNGARVEALGAGMVIPANRLRAAGLARSLRRLASSDAIHARCAQLAGHFTIPYDPTALCEAIERFALARLDDAHLVDRAEPPDSGKSRGPTLDGF